MIHFEESQPTNVLLGAEYWPLRKVVGTSMLEELTIEFWRQEIPGRR